MKKPEKNHNKSMAPYCDPASDLGKPITVGGEGGGLYNKEDPVARKGSRIHTATQGTKAGMKGYGTPSYGKSGSKMGGKGGY